MKLISIPLIQIRKKIWSLSIFLITFSFIGILTSTFYPSIKKPINLGMDYVGGNEIRLERICTIDCSIITSDKLISELRLINKENNLINNIRFQIQNNNSLISIRTPFLSIDSSEKLINDINKIAGPIDLEILVSKLIGPTMLFISLISFSELSILRKGVLIEIKLLLF